MKMADTLRVAGALALILALPSCSDEAADAMEVGEASEAVTEASVETISAQELAQLIAEDKVVLVDVRSPEEFAAVHLAGALNAPISTFDASSIPMEADRETILYCRSSRRSGQAAEQLSEEVQGKVRHLEGGIIAWEEAGLETIAEPAPAS